MGTASEDPLKTGSVPWRTLVVTTWTLFAVTTVLMACRLAIRIRLHHRIFWDDILAIVAFILLLAQDVLALIIAPLNYMINDFVAGKIEKPADFDPKVADMLKLSVAINIFFASVVYAVKASFLGLMWRLVRDLILFRRTWYVCAGIVVVFYLGTVALEPIACAKLYNNGCVSEADAQRNLVTLRLGTALDVSTDVMIMALPVVFTLKSKLPMAKKIGLLVLFCMGFIIVAMAIVRIVSLDNATKHPSISWKIFWGILESTVAVMTSCFASFKSLLTMHFRSSKRTPYPYGAKNAAPSGTLSGRHHSRLDGQNDLEFPLVRRSKQDSTKDANSVTVSGGQGPESKWDDSGSREEILQHTEFEVQYDRPRLRY